jgi:ferredoxin
MIRPATILISELTKRGKYTQRVILSHASTQIGINNSRGSAIRSASLCWNGTTNTSDDDISRRTYTSTAATAKTVSITYIEADGTSKTVDAEVGTDLMSAAHDNDIELEGACGGELACSTCHLIFDPDIYDSLPEKEDEEDDMLDLAFEVTDTSRLGCQIIVQEDFDGMTVQIPDDGF